MPDVYKRQMQEDKVEIKDRDVVILGAGGVGRAIAFLCAQKGAERVTILNRSVDKACSVAEEVKEKTGYQAIHARTIAEAGRLDGRDYLAIQATSVGFCLLYTSIFSARRRIKGSGKGVRRCLTLRI